jgi:thiol-disulfide isomerase/thioredoxin
MGSVTKALLRACLVPAVCLAGAEQWACAADGSLERGEQLLREVAEAYRSAPAFTDRMRYEARDRRSGRVDVREIAAGSESNARLVIDGFVFTALQEQVFIQRVDLPGKYYARALEGNLVATYAAMTGGRPLPVPQLAMRYGRSLEDYMPALGMSVATNLKLTGHGDARRGDRSVQELQFAGDHGATVKALIDPATRFIEHIEVKLGSAVVSATMSPKRHDRLPQAIAFDRAGRRQVESLQQAMALGEGDPAPDFTLTTLQDRTVTLSALGGSMVVIDFWATWCGPCRMSLPRLQAFHDWARQEGLAVEVLTVNTGERMPTNERKKAAAAAFWRGQGLTMPVLMDYDNSVGRAYDVGGIPHLVVVAPDGTIVETEVGFNPEVTEHLKRIAGELRIPKKRRTGR